MRTANSIGKRTGAVLPAFAFCLLALTAAIAEFPCGLMPAPAARFFSYLNAPEHTGSAVDVWERVTASVVLASASHPVSRPKS